MSSAARRVVDNAGVARYPTSMRRRSQPTLRDLASSYIKVIEQIERTSDPQELRELEEQRVIWHNRFADALRAAGIPYRDREHVTRMALRMAREDR